MGSGERAKHSETWEDPGAHMKNSKGGCWTKQMSDAGALLAKGGRLTQPKLLYVCCQMSLGAGLTLFNM